MPYITTVSIILFAVVILYNTIKILKEYERGVIFLLGRFQTVKGPGLIILFPGIQKMTKVDLRVIVMDVPTQGPSPRKLRPASVSTASGTAMTNRAVITGSVLGKTCRIVMRPSLAPVARAAST